MRYALHRVGRILFQRWHTTPGKGDLPEILRAMAIARKEAGSDLVVVEVVSPAAGLPDAEATREALSIVGRMRFFSSVHLIVIEGDARHRTLVRGMFQLVNLLVGDAFASYRTVHEALDRACAITGQNVPFVRREIEAAGLLHARSEMWT